MGSFPASGVHPAFATVRVKARGPAHAASQLAYRDRDAVCRPICCSLGHFHALRNHCSFRSDHRSRGTAATLRYRWCGDWARAARFGPVVESGPDPRENDGSRYDPRLNRYLAAATAMVPTDPSAAHGCRCFLTTAAAPARNRRDRVAAKTSSSRYDRCAPE